MSSPNADASLQQLIDVDCNLLHFDLKSVMSSISTLQANPNVREPFQLLHHPSTKSSNIIEDIEVIRQMQQVVVSQCQTQSVDERTVNKKAFDLILCFDDIISNGYRESVTISQIESYVDMDSTDEKIHRKQQMIKESDMKDLAKMKARDMAKARLDPNYQRDTMQAISSQDYEVKPA